MALEPITRQEQIIAGKDLKPITRMERFLKEYGGGFTTVEFDCSLDETGENIQVECPYTYENLVSLRNGGEPVWYKIKSADVMGADMGSSIATTLNDGDVQYFVVIVVGLTCAVWMFGNNGTVKLGETKLTGGVDAGVVGTITWGVTA